MGYKLQNEVAKQITKMNFVGDVIPHSWLSHIRKRDGKAVNGDKPYLLAIMILANICYWYRLAPIRDEQTDLTIGWEQKFEKDMLQKSYEDYSLKYGVGERTVKRAIDFLEKEGLIRREFRDLKIKGKHLSNVMFLEPIVSKIKEITYKDLDKFRGDKDVKFVDNPADKDVNRGVNDGDKDVKAVDKLPDKDVQDKDVRSKSVDNDKDVQDFDKDVSISDKDVKTYTENTTEITTEDKKNLDKITYYNKAWKNCLEKIKLRLSNPSFETWFLETSIDEIKNQEVYIKTPNSFIKDWVENRYINLIESILQEEFKKRYKVQVIVRS